MGIKGFGEKALTVGAAALLGATPISAADTKIKDLDTASTNVESNETKTVFDKYADYFDLNDSQKEELTVGDVKETIDKELSKLKALMKKMEEDEDKSGYTENNFTVTISDERKMVLDNYQTIIEKIDFLNEVLAKINGELELPLVPGTEEYKIAEDYRKETGRQLNFEEAQELIEYLK